MMRYLITIFALLLFPFSVFAITLTSDVTYDYLEIGTGATLDTDGFDVTVGGGTGATIIYGFLDATHLNGNSTLFTQKANGFITLGTGDVKFTQTGTLLLTSSGTDVTNPNTLTVSGSLMDLTIDNGLVGYWRLDDGIGSTVARDSSRYGNHGTLTAMDPSSDWVANPAHSMGSFFNPYALDFDGSNDYVNLGQDISEFENQTFTISLWAKISAGGGNRYFFGHYYYPAPSEEGILFEVDPNDNFAFWTRVGTRVTNTSKVVDDGEWHHFVGVMNQAANQKLAYVDGIAASGTANTMTYGGGRSWTVGGIIDYPYPNNTPWGATTGQIDDVRIYNRALSANEVERLSEGDPSTGSGVYSLGSALNLSGNLGIYAGELRTGNAYGITLSGSWVNAGAFTSTGTVTFDGSNQTITGSTVFHNLTKTSGTLNMDFRARQNFSGALVLQNLTLRSTKTGSAANILLDGSAGTQTVDNVNVADNDASGGATIVCSEGCTDAGNVQNWDFTDITDAVTDVFKSITDFFFIME